MKVRRWGHLRHATVVRADGSTFHVTAAPERPVKGMGLPEWCRLVRREGMTCPTLEERIAEDWS